MVMKKSIMIKKGTDIHESKIDKCHGGTGSIIFKEVISHDETKFDALNFIHDDIVPPGVSIGEHEHTADEEYYLIISGKGKMILDGEEFEIEAGDITAVYPGSSHGLVNNSDSDLRIIVISVASENIDKDETTH